MKHTEGPWHVWNEQYPRVGPTHNCTVAGVFACPSGDQQANARLIAAAPDLLAHLKHMGWLVETELKEDGGHIMQGAKDAIAKATE